MADPSRDDTGTSRSHDRQGRGSGPYVPPGVDASGTPQPAVPHEGLLGRLAVVIVAVEAVVLLVVAVAGYVVSAGSGFLDQPDVTFLALRLNPAHSTLLLLTAVVGLAAVARRRALRAFAGVQTVVYFIVFAFGTAFSVNTAGATPLDLNTPDHVLHGLLAILGLITLMISSARIVEPPPGSDPYAGDPGAQEGSAGRDRPVEPDGPSDAGGPSSGAPAERGGPGRN